MNIRIALVSLAVVSCWSWAQGQGVNPDEDAVYLEKEITEVRITMSVEDKELIHLEENRWEEIYVPSEVTVSNSMLDAVVANGTGVRLRGNTSRGHDKRAYKIDFREFGGSKFEGYKKFNLKPNVNDPSVVRELLSMHFYRLMDVPATRITPATVYINEEYMGVYLNVEQIDDEFVDSRFGHENGFLYKCSWGANLNDDDQIYDNEIYESKINEDEDARMELAHFVDVLNNTAKADFAQEIEKVFNVDSYLRQLAVEAILGHWDGYSYNQNNYYLFYDAETTLIEFIPYDTDNTWGIDWVNGDWAKRSLTSFHQEGQPRALTSKILDVDDYREKYYDYLRELYENYFTEDYLWPLFDHFEDLLSPMVQVDSYFGLSFGFSLNDFVAGYDDGVNQHVEYGLRDFVLTRRSNGWSELLNVTGLEAREELVVYPNPAKVPYFQFEGSSTSEINVFDMMGRKLPVNVSQANINILRAEVSSNTPSGIYIVEIDGVKTRWHLQH